MIAEALLGWLVQMLGNTLIKIPGAKEIGQKRARWLIDKAIDDTLARLHTEHDSQLRQVLRERITVEDLFRPRPSLPVLSYIKINLQNAIDALSDAALTGQGVSYFEIIRVDPAELTECFIRCLTERVREFVYSHNFAEVAHALIAEKTDEAATSTGKPINCLPPRPDQLVNHSKLLTSLRTEAIDGVARVFLLHGMPGIGKTTIANSIAHEISANYPDGCFFLDLCGYTDYRQPLSPHEALRSLLIPLSEGRAAGLDDLTCCITLWRATTKHARMLLVLDDARSASQIESLIPASDNSLTIITSRRMISSRISMRSLRVTRLSPESSYELLRCRSGGASISPALIKEHVGRGLPLAIILLAARLSHGEITLDSVSDWESQLMGYGEDEESAQISAAIDRIYEQLKPPEQRLLRLLGVYPDAEFDVYYASAISNQELAVTLSQLESLLRWNLVEGRGDKSYALHSVIRTYARSMLLRVDPEPERRHAYERVVDYHIFLMYEIDSGINLLDHMPRSVIRFDVRSDLKHGASGIIFAERVQPGVELSLTLAQELGDRTRLINQISVAAYYLKLSGRWAKLVELCHLGASYALELADSMAAGHLTFFHAEGQRLKGDAAGASELYRVAQQIFLQIGDEYRVARTLHAIGDNYRDNIRNYRAARRAYADARGILDNSGNQLAAARISHGIADLDRSVGDVRAAREGYEQLLTQYEHLGDSIGEARALHGLARINLSAGEFESCSGQLVTALKVYVDRNDKLGEAEARLDISRVHLAAGNRTKALEQAEAARLLAVRLNGSMISEIDEVVAASQE